LLKLIRRDRLRIAPERKIEFPFARLPKKYREPIANYASGFARGIFDKARMRLRSLRFDENTGRWEVIFLIKPDKSFRPPMSVVSLHEVHTDHDEARGFDYEFELMWNQRTHKSTLILDLQPTQMQKLFCRMYRDLQLRPAIREAAEFQEISESEKRKLEKTAELLYPSESRALVVRDKICVRCLKAECWH
jgi:hypothetical protein